VRDRTGEIGLECCELISRSRLRTSFYRSIRDLKSGPDLASRLTIRLHRDARDAVCIRNIVVCPPFSLSLSLPLLERYEWESLDSVSQKDIRCRLVQYLGQANNKANVIRNRLLIAQIILLQIIIVLNKLFLRKLGLTRIVAFNISFLTLWLLITAMSEKYLFI